MLIIGRSAERARIAALVAGDHAGTAGPARVLVLVGDPGTGKSTLLEEAAALAADGGATVLSARGAPIEHEIPHALLHRLLLPLLGGLDRLPPRQRSAVEAAFGIGDGDSAPDLLHLAVATLTLLSDAAADAGLLVVVDDVQWTDPASARVLELVAGRLDGERVTMLLASRPGAGLASLPQLTLEPLDRATAGALLDAVADVPPGAGRRLLLDQAQGNPLAIVELARVTGPSDSDKVDGAVGGLTERLERAFAARTDTFPQRTRRVLLRAAASGDDEAGVLLRQTADSAHGLTLEDWIPAEKAGLVRLGPGTVRFRHPLVRSALYWAAPLAERRRAHLDLAELLRDDPYRHARHLAAAAVGPDDAAADALESSADYAQRRGGWIAAARWLERAADLSPAAEDRARRMLRAARCAMYSGHGALVVDLAARVADVAEAPDQLAEAEFLRGWALSQSLDHAGAVTLLTTAADAASRAGATEVALAALAPAGVAAYFAGDPALTERVRATLAAVGPSPAPHGVWVAAAVDPVGATADTVAELSRRLDAAGGVRGLDVVSLNALSGAAWIVDETPLAIELMRAFLEGLDRPDTKGEHALVGNTLGSALLETGRWDEAWRMLEWTVRVAAETGMDVVGRSAMAEQAHLAALRGDGEDARRFAAQAISGIARGTSRSLEVRVQWALGLAALAEGDWERAYRHLRQLVERGSPSHPHLALYALPDLVQAAVRTGRVPEARSVARILAERTTGGSPRLCMLAAHAQAVVAGGAPAEASFRSALEDSRGERWVVERARVSADYGTWLRRQRRVREAREHLGMAHETFARVGARPWAEHTERELRAAGVRPRSTTRTEHGDALASLTPQQRQVVLLAAEGLTNREIGERLFLSPRTVGFHLYQVFPLLGVTSRMQLRDVVASHQPVT